MIFLRHAIHGIHKVFSDQAAKVCEKNGWERTTEDEILKGIIDLSDGVSDEEAELAGKALSARKKSKKK